MKARNTLIITILLGITMNAMAQKNVIKAGLPNIFYGEYQLGYERMINNRQSIQLKAGYFQPVSSFLIDEKLFQFTNEYRIEGVNGGFQTSLEYRFYMTGTEKPSGFYVAPYARIAQLSMLYTDKLTPNNLDFNVDATATIMGLGAQLGYQWLIKDRVCIDFNFFGAGVDFWNAKLIYTRDGFTNYSSIEPDIRKAVEVGDDIKRFIDPTKKLTTKVNSDNLTARFPFVLPGFRIGLSVGIAF
jgi:hypothetical protein